MTSHPKSPRTTGNEAGFGMIFDAGVHDLSQFCAVAVYTMSDGIASRAFRYSVNMVLVGVQKK